MWWLLVVVIGFVVKNSMTTKAKKNFLTTIHSVLANYESTTTTNIPMITQVSLMARKFHLMTTFSWYNYRPAICRIINSLTSQDQQVE
jgi:hypothetical protein